MKAFDEIERLYLADPMNNAARDRYVVALRALGRDGDAACIELAYLSHTWIECELAVRSTYRDSREKWKAYHRAVLDHGDESPEAEAALAAYYKAKNELQKQRKMNSTTDGKITDVSRRARKAGVNPGIAIQRHPEILTKSHIKRMSQRINAAYAALYNSTPLSFRQLKENVGEIRATNYEAADDIYKALVHHYPEFDVTRDSTGLLISYQMQQ